MTEPQHFVGIDAVVDRERRRLRFAQDLERGDTHLDLTGGDGVVDRALGPVAHLALYLHDVLTAHAVHVGARDHLGVDDDLHDARGVAHVEEQHAAMVATAVDPSAEHDVAPDVSGAEIAGPVGTHHCWVSTLSRSQPARSSRGTSTCSAVRRSLTATAPRAASCAPSITPYVAPDLSATFHCAFTERSP